jgi:hypothetical protein
MGHRYWPTDSLQTTWRVLWSYFQLGVLALRECAQVGILRMTVVVQNAAYACQLRAASFQNIHNRLEARAPCQYQQIC